MKVAIIDLGTNTFNLLLADLGENHKYQIIYKEELNVKLGEGSLIKNFISPLPFQRGIEAMMMIKETIDHSKVDIVKAFATSAIREASNGPEFIADAIEETGIQIQVLNGDQEADYIYRGVKLTDILYLKPSLIMDIGGGSTEFIIADNHELHFKQSLNLGAARLKQQFNFEDPFTNDQIYDLNEYFGQQLAPLFKEIKKYRVKQLIGCSGSFESFATMITHKYSLPKIKPLTKSRAINPLHFRQLYKMLVHSTERERMRIPGLVEMRVDTIVFAAMFVNFMMKKFRIRELVLSQYALKEGALQEIIYGDK